MNAELQKKIETASVYDGWKKSFLCWYENGLQRRHITKFDYHENIASLWPVAKRVCDELSPINGYAAEKISDASGEFGISALFEAVVNGIELLNKYKQTTK